LTDFQHYIIPVMMFTNLKCRFAVLILFRGVPERIPQVIRPLLAHTARNLACCPPPAVKNALSWRFLLLAFLRLIQIIQRRLRKFALMRFLARKLDSSSGYRFRVSNGISDILMIAV